MSWDDDHKDVCQVWDCELPARQYGVCAKHLKIAELGDPRDDETQQVLALIKAGKDGNKMTDGKCRVPGCGKNRIADDGSLLITVNNLLLRIHPDGRTSQCCLPEPK